MGPFPRVYVTNVLAHSPGSGTTPGAGVLRLLRPCRPACRACCARPCASLPRLLRLGVSLFIPDFSMRQFMWQNDLPQLARYVIKCLKFLAAAQSTS